MTREILSQTESVWFLVLFTVCSRALTLEHTATALTFRPLTWQKKREFTDNKRHRQQKWIRANVKTSSSAVVPRLTAGSLKCVVWCGVVWRVRWKPRWKPSSQPVVCVCRLTPPRWRLSFPGCPAPSDRSWPASERAWRNAGTSAASRASRARRPPPLAPEVMASPFKGRKHYKQKSLHGGVRRGTYISTECHMSSSGTGNKCSIYTVADIPQ